MSLYAEHLHDRLIAVILHIVKYVEGTVNILVDADQQDNSQRCQTLPGSQSHLV